MKRKLGFTLIEIVVVMAIGSAILLALVSVFSVATRAHHRYTDQEELTQNARVALERITRDLRQTSEIITLLPTTNTDALNPPATQIIFADGHDTDKIRYINYHLDGTSLKRQLVHYYFSTDPGTWVVSNAKDSFGNPPLQSIDEDVVKADKITSIKFWGTDNINIDLTVANDSNTFSFHDSVVGRNL